MQKKDLALLLERLRIEPKKNKYYIQALTHSSYANERGLAGYAHNERLEFLGDAVLGLVVSEMLYSRFKEFPEGKLTRIRSQLVREETLARLAQELGLGVNLRLSKGEAASGGRQRASILADALEALIAAIYLDLGFTEVQRVAREIYEELLTCLENGTLSKDYKTLMQEYAQGRLATTPEYRIVSEEGPDHFKTFVANFIINDRVYGEGSGRTKKEAEQEAARSAYEQLISHKK
ncbi:MAG: ribonuclease III [Dethiobacter sp.]|jgi:ribonuclease III|nr:ribonuclease III [Dethiobacter sp.]